MRKIAAAIALLASTAWAGECLLGVISSTDGGAVSNATTGYGAAGCAAQANGCAGACAQAFPIGSPQLLSIQCAQAAYVAVDSNQVDAGNGVAVAAALFFTSSTGNIKRQAPLPDGGSYSGGMVTILPNGAAAATCSVWTRQGNE